MGGHPARRRDVGGQHRTRFSGYAAGATGEPRACDAYEVALLTFHLALTAGAGSLRSAALQAAHYDQAHRYRLLLLAASPNPDRTIAAHRKIMRLAAGRGADSVVVARASISRSVISCAMTKAALHHPAMVGWHQGFERTAGRARIAASRCAQHRSPWPTGAGAEEPLPGT